MRISGWVFAPLGIVGGLIAFATALTLAPSVASATPGFARQTGLSCQGCHTVFPELTPFGRKFKLNAYVFSNVKEQGDINEQRQRTLALSDFPPLSAQLQASLTALNKSLPDSCPTTPTCTTGVRSCN